MISLGCFFSVAFVLWGAAVVWHDFLFSKIRNSWLRIGIYICAVGYLYFIRVGVIFYKNAAWQIAIGTVFGVGLWLWKIWPAGDAKFLIICSLFVPLTSFATGGLPNGFIFHALVNSFILAGIYVLLSMFVSAASSAIKMKHSIFDLRNSLAWHWLAAWMNQPKKFFSALNQRLPYVFNIFSFFFLQAALQRFFSLRLAQATPFIPIFVFLLWDKIGWLFASRHVFYISITAILSVVISSEFIPHVQSVFRQAAHGFGVFSVLFVVAQLVLMACADYRSRYKVQPIELDVGMILSPQSIQTLRRDREYFDRHFSPIFRDGLSNEQVRALQKWLSFSENQGQTIEVLRSKPFSLWIFMGILISLCLRIDIFHWVLFP